MTDLHEQLSDVIEVAIDNAHDIDVTHRDYANASADAIMDALPGMVQPLEWRDVAGGWGSDDFYIMPLSVGGYRVYGISGNYDGAAQFESLDAAKAEAQARHVATIMQALGVQGESK